MDCHEMLYRYSVPQKTNATYLVHPCGPKRLVSASYFITLFNLLSNHIWRRAVPEGTALTGEKRKDPAAMEKCNTH